MKKDWLEKKLLEELSGDMHTDINLDDMWNEIEEKRYPSKRRFPFFWIFIGCIPLLCILIMTLRKTTIVDNLSGYNSNLDTHSPVSKNDHKQLIGNESIMMNDLTQDRGTTPAVNNLQNTLSTSPQINDTDSRMEPSQNKLSRDKTKGKTGRFDQLTEKRPRNENPFWQSNLFLQNSLNKDQTNNPIYENHNEGIIIPKTITEEIEADNETAKWVTRVLKSELKPLQHQLILTLPFADNTWNTNSNTNPWQIDILYSYGISSGKLEGTSMSINDRLSNERYIDAQELGIYVSYPLGSKVFVRSGIEYNQHLKNYKKNFNYEYTEEREDVLLEVIYKNDGTTEYVRGPGRIKVIDSGNVNTYHRHMTVAVPLEIGYNILSQRNLSVRYTGGFSIGYGFASGYSVYDEANAVSTQITNLGYQSGINVAAKSAIGLQTKLTESLDFNLGINVSVDLTDRNRLTTDEEKFNRMGFFTGVSFRL